MTEELKPCPFCGKNDAQAVVFKDAQHVVACSARTGGPGGCGASAGWHTSKADAIAAWNQRTAPSGATGG